MTIEHPDGGEDRDLPLQSLTPEQLKERSEAVERQKSDVLKELFDIMDAILKQSKQIEPNRDQLHAHRRDGNFEGARLLLEQNRTIVRANQERIIQCDQLEEKLEQLDSDKKIIEGLIQTRMKPTRE